MISPFRRANPFVLTGLPAAAVTIMFAALVSGMLFRPALAQDANIKSLIDRVDRLQRELITLQRQVYRGEAPPEPAPGALSGDSGGLSTTVAARIELRLSQLEAQLRELTGQIEEANYRQTQLRGQIDKLAADTDLRLRQLEQGGAGMAAGAVTKTGKAKTKP